MVDDAEEKYREQLYNAMLMDLKEQSGEEKYKENQDGWESRVKDEMELFFEGDGERDY